MSKIIVPRGMVYIADETMDWLDEDLIRDCGGWILGVYAFDERRQVRCCEITPSFELHFLGSIPGCAVTPSFELHFLGSIPGALSKDERFREGLEERLREANHGAQDTRYVHTHVLGDLIKKAFSERWDGETAPCCIDVWTPEADLWQKILEDHEGDEEAAHTAFMESLEEIIQSSGVY